MQDNRSVSLQGMEPPNPLQKPSGWGWGWEGCSKPSTFLTPEGDLWENTFSPLCWGLCRNWGLCRELKLCWPRWPPRCQGQCLTLLRAALRLGSVDGWEEPGRMKRTELVAIFGNQSYSEVVRVSPEEQILDFVRKHEDRAVRSHLGSGTPYT